LIRTIIFSSSVPEAWEPELPELKSEKAVATGREGPSMIDPIAGCTESLTRLTFVVSPPIVFAFARRDAKDTGMPEKRVLSLCQDGDLCIGLRGVGGDESNLNLVCGESVIGLGREVDSKSAKRSAT